MRNKIVMYQRILSVAFALVVLSGTSFAQSKDSLIEITNSEIGKLYKTSSATHVSVHDPSIIVDNTGSQKKYYVYGSHLAAGYSTNLKSWSSCKWTFSSSSHYSNNQTTKVRILQGTDTVDADFGPFDAEQWRYTAANSDVAGNQWAPDCIWNPNMGKWCLYMSLNGNDWRSVIVLLTADKVTGPYTYQGPVVFSGFQWTDLANQTWKQTDMKLVQGLQDITSLPSRYNVGSSWGSRWPNCIDPCVFFDDNGQLWMSYGSWSGGIFILKLDKNTGLRDYTVKYNVVGSGNAATEDPYFGKKIAGGYYVSGEGSYIQKIGSYYYLFMSYGGLSAAEGYEMRYFRCETPDGTYKDAKGNLARFSSYQMNYGPNATSNAGNRVFGSYKWESMSDAELAQGHNSVLLDDDGKAYLIYHTRFANGGEGHQVRVHQLYQNAPGWLVAAPYEYTGGVYNQDSIENNEVCSTFDIVGTYKIIMHSYKLNYADKEYKTEKTIYLSADGNITGDYTGTWKLTTAGKSYIQIKIGSTTYNGVILPQNVSGSNMNAVCFMAHNNQGVAVWGSNADGKLAVDANYIKYKSTLPVKAGTLVTEDIELTTPSPLYGAEFSWYSERPDIMNDEGHLLVNTTTDTSVASTSFYIVRRCAKDNYYYNQRIMLRVRIAPGMKGDANGDGVVDVADITAIAADILGMTPETFNRNNADVNADGVIDVADITATASIILTAN